MYKTEQFAAKKAQLKGLRLAAANEMIIMHGASGGEMRKDLGVSAGDGVCEITAKAIFKALAAPNSNGYSVLLKLHLMGFDLSGFRLAINKIVPEEIIVPKLPPVVGSDEVCVGWRRTRNNLSGEGAMLTFTFGENLSSEVRAFFIKLFNEPLVDGLGLADLLMAHTFDIRTLEFSVGKIKIQSIK